MSNQAFNWKLLETKRPSSAHEVMEILLANRNMKDSFLNPHLGDLKPYLNISGMDEGARIVAEHLDQGHKVVVVGDYDCDGITSAAQLALFFDSVGFNRYEVVIANRKEGYGIPRRAVTDNPNAKLLISLDCGALDRNVIGLAKANGMDCVVIDHHEVPGELLAPADVIIDPKQAGCPSSFKEFCASGLFLAKLRKALGADVSIGAEYIILATIGTIAEI
jgi:single-stranded-DNA-specific exonuclease